MSLLLLDNFTEARRMYSMAEFCFTVSLKFIALILSVPWLLLLLLSNLSNRCATKEKSRLICYKNGQTSKMGTNLKWTSLFWEQPERAQSLVSFLFRITWLNKLMRGLKIIGMLLNVVHGQVKKTCKII